MKRRTIAKDVNFKGIGLHKGEEISLKLVKASSGTGIVFKRVDLEEGKNEIKLCLENTFDLVSRITSYNVCYTKLLRT